MDFRLTEEQQELRDTARRYAREKLVPIAEELERTGEPPSHELIREYADTRPLYRLTDDDLAQVPGTLSADAVRIRDGHVLITLQPTVAE